MSEILTNTGAKLWSKEDYTELWLDVFEQLTGSGGKSNIRLIDEAIGKINTALNGYYFSYENTRLYICKDGESSTTKLPVSLVDTNGNIASTVDGTTVTIDSNGVIHGITVDDAFSLTSENPVQNKVITTKLNKLNEDISFSDHDTATSGTSFTDAEDGNMLITDWTKNLLKPTLETTTKNGVTCTRNVDANGNPDGTYTLNGTATENATFITTIKIELANGKYKLCGSPSSSSNTTYFMNYWSEYNYISDIGNGLEFTFSMKEIASNNVAIQVRKGVTVDNVTFKPMLTTDLSATYDDFVPYGGYEIQSCGKNLIPFPYYAKNDNVSGGLTFNYGDDATIIANGIISGSYAGFAIARNIKVDAVNKKYMIIGLPTNGSASTHKLRIRYNLADGTQSDFTNCYSANGNILNKKDSTYEGATMDIDLMCYNDKDNFKVRPMLVEVSEDGTYSADYEPYTGETITVTNDTESPAFGLKSHKGITNIISPGNVKCVYPTNESGVSVLEKERQLDDNKSDVVIDKSTGNKVVFTIENGIICAREA